MNKKDMALTVIEALVSDDLCEDIAMNLVHKREFNKKDVEIMGNKILTIYRVSHSVNAHSCYAAHDDWRKEMMDLYNKLEGINGKELMGTEKVIEGINYFFDVWALRPNYAMEQAKEYLAAYTEEQVSEAVKAERERLLSYEPLTEVDKLSDGIALVLLAEWVAIENDKTRLQANEYMESAQELADYLYLLGYRLLRTDKRGGD